MAQPRIDIVSGPEDSIVLPGTVQQVFEWGGGEGLKKNA